MPAAWREAFTAHLPALQRYALALTGDAAEAAELVQACWEMALQAPPPAAGVRVDSWLFRTAQTLWAERRRAAYVPADPDGAPTAWRDGEAQPRDAELGAIGSGCPLIDEPLNAYIDGEPDAVEAADVALALTHDREAARRLNALHKADVLLREAFKWEPPGGSALTQCMAQQMASPSRSGRLARRLALASVGALGAAALGFGLSRPMAPGPVRIDPVAGAVAGGALARALETQRSDQDGPVQISMTFRAKDGRICRRFAQGAGFEGLACRDEGRWLLPMLAAPAAAPDTTGVQAAGGGSDPLDGAVRAAGVAQLIDLAGESALIRTGWR